ncbi:glucose 1-dehydrogenase [Tranquillimonas rosea]|uniref:Glucose 1-dehydrogenase n=1 Tax=Tranquillimonas rosea TaxID=641238 RepID=A0A1H9RDN1_9RHOB|nr:SDR family oxidoreductase [Tranquillimonas rosea]SER70870.1 glucose 1-dehydrogenase [Tranquillimonas rosea]
MTSPLFDLTGKRALVTGSSGGIGRALARGLAEHGAEVILNGRTENTLAEAAEAFRADGLTVSYAAFDVTDPEAVKAGIVAIERDHGTIDILINNAGIQHRAPLEEFPEEAWDRLIATNVTSLFHVSKAVAPGMIAKGEGRIINIASVQAELARPGIAPYTATKGAVRNLTRGMSTDWARHGLRVNALAPGYFKTPLNKALTEDADFTAWLEKRTPAARWGNVEELVGTAVYLSSQAASFVTGQTLFVDGGMTTSV